MSIIESINFLPNLQDLVVPAVVAAIYWLLRKIISPGIQGLANWFRRLRIKELKRAKAIRPDPFAIQRQLSKESALFNAFLLSAIVSLGLMLIIMRSSQSLVVNAALFGIYMTPVIAMEIWWLWHKEFVSVLLAEAGRLGATYKRTIPPRIQSPLRINNRKARQEAAARKLSPKTRLVARRLS